MPTSTATSAVSVVAVPAVTDTIDTFAANCNSDYLLRPKQHQKRAVTFDTNLVKRVISTWDPYSATKPAPAVRLLRHAPNEPAFSNKSFYTGIDPYRPDDTVLMYSSIRDYNSRQLLNYGNLQYLLQGISSPHYTDVEFIAEQIKRPRITNQQNSSKCACIPREFESFVSFFNIGSLSTAGRCMNLCARTKLSFFANPVVQVAEQYFRWFCDTYANEGLFSLPRVSLLHCIRHGIYRCAVCFLFLIINEVPYCNILVDKCLEYQMFLASKLRWPAIQFYRKANVVLSVSIQSGIIMVPVCISHPDARPATSLDAKMRESAATQQATTATASSGSTVPPPSQRTDIDSTLSTHRWVWCANCGMYFPSDHRLTSKRFVLDDQLRPTYHRAIELHAQRTRGRSVNTNLKRLNRQTEYFVDGTMNICDRHIWFSPNDLAYSRLYRSSSATPQPRATPLYYEIVCHGGLSCARNLASVDISKTIVSINAAKRRLRLGSQMAPRHSNKSPFESLIDQNARILVYTDIGLWREAQFDRLPGKRDALVLADRRNEPLRHIVNVPKRNTFFCCFAFGDSEGLNCEDAYVMSEHHIPWVENVIELKVNYYKFDRSVIKTGMVQLLFRPRLVVNPGAGCTIIFGEIVSYYKLSFGSTMINVKLLSKRGNIFRYVLSYTGNAAYLRRGSKIFEDLPNGARGLDFNPPEVSLDRYNDHELAKHNSKYTILMLYEAVAVTRNGNVVVSVQMNTKQLRFRVSLKNIRTCLKIQNNCGQKGMAVMKDLSDLYTDRGGDVHLIVSSYSVPGRQPMSQLLEQRSFGGCDEQFSPMMRVYSRKAGGRQVGWAGYGEFFFSCDSPHDNIIVSGPNCGNNPMRVCNLTYYAAIDSGLSTAIFNRNSDYENYKNNPANGMPVNISKLLSVYRYYNRDINFKSFTARRVREHLRDWLNVSALGVRASLPDYLKSSLVPVATDLIRAVNVQAE